MSRKSSPWENGYQESFYSQFKLDLGDPNRFESPGALIAEVYRLIFVYNHFRIHSKLKMPPKRFAALQMPKIPLHEGSTAKTTSLKASCATFEKRDDGRCLLTR